MMKRNSIKEILLKTSEHIILAWKDMDVNCKKTGSWSYDTAVILVFSAF